MAEPDSDAANKDEVVVDDKDPKEVSGIPPTLDQVHEITQRKLEDEDAEQVDDDKSEDKDEDPTDDDKPDVDEDDEPTGDEDSPVADEDEPDKKSDELPAPTTPEDSSSTTPQLDTDITKNAQNKVAIEGLDGKTYYFNNIAEVPDDFEPATYKKLMVGIDALNDKKVKDQADQAKADEDAIVADNKKRADDMQVSWEKDADVLTSAGFLPKDAVKNAAAKEEVYDYMEAEMKKGNVITNFTQAYKAMMFDKEQEQKVEEQKKINDAKKKRGGTVQAGSGGAQSTGGGNRGKVIEAPPSGAGLDAVHNAAIRDL